MAAKRIGRSRFLTERYGEAAAARSIGRDIATKSQYAALHNQFVQCNLSKDECREIMGAAHDVSEAAAHLQDVLAGIRADGPKSEPAE